MDDHSLVDLENLTKEIKVTVNIRVDFAHLADDCDVDIDIFPNLEELAHVNRFFLRGLANVDRLSHLFLVTLGYEFLCRLVGLLHDPAESKDADAGARENSQEPNDAASNQDCT